MEIIPNLSSFLPYEEQFITEILHSNELILNDRLLIDCQTDLFEILNQEQAPSSILTDRRWRLQLFLGYYTFIHQHVDFLFNMETFTEKFYRFLINTLDFETLTRTNLHRLNETSLINHQQILFNEIEYHSVYKHFKCDVHDEISELIRLFLISHDNFIEYLFEKINTKKLIDENNQKIFYLLAICFERQPWKNFEEYQRMLSLLNQLISEEKNDRRRRRKKAKKGKFNKNKSLIEIQFI